VLGVADLTGELMRYAINAIGQGNHPAAFEILITLRSLSAGACRELRGQTCCATRLTVVRRPTDITAHPPAFNNLNQFQVYGLRAKMTVLHASLEKVEKGTTYVLRR